MGWRHRHNLVFSGAREYAPGPRSRPNPSPQFRSLWATKEAHRRALNQPDGLLRSEAGQGHGRFLPVTLPRGASNQRKQAADGNHRSPTPRGTHQGRGWGTHQGRDQGGDHSRTGQAPELGELTTDGHCHRRTAGLAGD